MKITLQAVHSMLDETLQLLVWAEHNCIIYRGLLAIDVDRGYFEAMAVNHAL